MNFNFGEQESLDNEYKLFRDTTYEMTQLYGIRVNYILTKKINQDDFFGEHSHISINNDSVHEFYVRPADTSMWEGENDIFSKYGLQNLDSMSIYIPRQTMEEIHPELTNKQGKATVDNLPNGNLVIFGNNKIMEVTDFKLAADDFGNNNVFTSDREKNVYKVTLKTYIYNHDDTSSASDISTSDTFEYEDFGNLESIFSLISDEEENVRHQSEDVLMEDEVIYPSEVRKKPVRIKTEEKNPFGDFG